MFGIASILAIAGCSASVGSAGISKNNLTKNSEPKVEGSESTRPARAVDEKVADKPRRELPRGGYEIFPAHRLVGYCGTPGAPALGPLHNNLAIKAKALEVRATNFALGRKVLPVLELIAVIVQAGPGSDGNFRYRVAHSVVDEYLRVARESKALLLLNIQPGRSDFLTEIKYFEKYLREPDVGIALDPEWAMMPGQIPGRKYGRMTGATLNDVASYLSSIIAEGNLPEKALVFHQVAAVVVRDESVLKSHPGVLLIKSADGLGPRFQKVATYGTLMVTLHPAVHAGFKLFFDEDTRKGSKLMTPAEVMALSPQPEYVMFE